MPWKTALKRSPSPKAKSYARKLRRDMTDAEKRLWWHLRDKLPMETTHFRRQFAIGPYIVDFACLERKVIIEVDGDQHGTDEALAYDARRDKYLAKQGFNLLRFSNLEVMTELDAVLDTIFDALNPTPPTQSILGDQ
jgi:very-short-patch-repair endonuclease